LWIWCPMDQIEPPRAKPDVHQVDMPHLVREGRLGGCQRQLLSRFTLFELGLVNVPRPGLTEDSVMFDIREMTSGFQIPRSEVEPRFKIVGH
jgi:hypothetical protein